MIKNIFIIRHALSEGNANREAYKTRPDYAIRLTEKGVEQARTIGTRLNDFEGNFLFFNSPYFRARQTLDHLKETLNPDKFVESIENPCLREQEWHGGPPQEFDNDQEKLRSSVSTFYYRFKNGESGAEVFERMEIFRANCIKPLLAKNQLVDNIGIVTHGYAARVLLMSLLGWDVETFEMVRNPKNAEIIQIAVDYELGDFKLISKLNIRPKLQHGFIYDKNDIYKEKQ